MRGKVTVSRAWSAAPAAALAALLLAAWPGPPMCAAPKLGVGEMASVRVKVLAVDLKNRTIDVQGPSGNHWVIEVDERVKRLPEVKPGDHINIKYWEAVAVGIKEAGTAKVGKVKSEKVHRAGPDSAPAGVVIERTTANMEVLVVNPRDNSVTVKNTKGQTEWIKVKDPDLKPYVKKLKVGDIVTITYDKALAISLEPA